MVKKSGKQKRSKVLTPEEIFEKCQASPIFFVETMWNLTPQPLRPEFEAEAKAAIEEMNWRLFRKKWFLPFIKGQHITWQQWVIFLALEAAVAKKASRHISIRSGHGIGKDTTIALIILWFLFSFKDSQIPCTAPTSDQLQDILWKEITKWHARMPDEVKVKYEITSQYVRIVESPAKWFARARTAKKEQPEALAGVHGEYVLYVAEEASGVAQEIYDTAEGALTNQEAYFIMISNPTRLDGYFYDSHHDDKANWQCLAFDGRDSPIVDWEFVDRMRNKHGEDSDEFRKRVAGEFPQKDMEMDGWTPILTKDEIDAALESEGVEHAGINAQGADVAGGNDGDESILVRKSMTLAEVLYASNRVNNILFAGEIIVYHEDYDLQYENTAIDTIGLGDGTANRLLEQKKPINKINITNKPTQAADQLLFADLKAYGYWQVREAIKNGLKLKSSKDSDGKERWYQLAQIRYKTMDSSGKIMIMPKSLMRKKGLGSPDCAEALMLAFCITPKAKETITKADIHFAKKMAKKLRMLKKK